MKYVMLALLFAASVARAEGTHWRLATPRGPIHVWIPANYDRATAVTVVFVHGYNIDTDTAWSEYKLEEQFAHADLNAMFIACAAPSTLAETVAWQSLPSLIATVAASVDAPMPAGDIVAVGHSAAYRTLVLWLGEPALRTLVLLDAAYGEEDRFMEWTRDDTKHRLINIASDTLEGSDWIAQYLPATKRVYGLPSNWTDEAKASRVLYVRTGVGHIAMITGGVALPLALRALK